MKHTDLDTISLHDLGTDSFIMPQTILYLEDTHFALGNLQERGLFTKGGIMCFAELQNPQGDDRCDIAVTVLPDTEYNDTVFTQHGFKTVAEFKESMQFVYPKDVNNDQS